MSSPTPILKPKAVLLLLSTLVGPAAGMFMPLPTLAPYALLLLPLLFFVVVATLEGQRAKRFFSTLKLSATIPQQILSMKESSLALCFDYPDERREVELSIRPQIALHLQYPKEILVRSVSPGKKSFLVEWKFTPLRRGELVWDYITMRYYPIGAFLSWQAKVPLRERTRALVYPNSTTDSSAKLRAIRTRFAGESPVHQSGGEGKEFDRLRKYAQGDDLRRVDWKRTARRGFPVVKMYRPETHQRLNIAIDCSQRMGNAIEGRLLLDYAADAAAFLSRLALEGGDEVGIFAFNHQQVAYVRSKRGKRHHRQLLNRLYELKTGELEADYNLIRSWADDNRRRSLLIVLTSLSTASGLDRIRTALQPVSKKHLPFVVAVYDRELAAVTERKVANLKSAFIQAAGVEQVEAIKRRVQVLRRSGIECAYTDVKEIPNLLAEKYYQLKLAGRL